MIFTPTQAIAIANFPHKIIEVISFDHAMDIIYLPQYEGCIGILHSKETSHLLSITILSPEAENVVEIVQDSSLFNMFLCHFNLDNIGARNAEKEKIYEC